MLIIGSYDQKMYALISHYKHQPEKNAHFRYDGKKKYIYSTRIYLAEK